MPRVREAAHRRSQREPLSRERIVKAALAEAAARGELTMRALGARLGADPMAVYRHFRDKEALIDEMVDAALVDFHPPSDLRDPLAELHTMALDFRAALLRHPGISDRVATTRPAVGPQTLLLAEATLERLSALGLVPREAASAFYSLVHYITGFVRREELVRARGPGAEAEWLEELRVAYGAAPPDRFPQVARMAMELPQQTLESQFRYGLGLLLDALAVRGEIS